MSVDKVQKDLVALESLLREHLIAFDDVKNTIDDNRSEALNIAIKIGEFISDLQIESSDIREELRLTKQELSKLTQKFYYIQTMLIHAHVLS